MVMLRRWSFQWKENGHVTEVDSLMEGEWSCYRSEHFNGGRENNVSEVVSLMEGKWSLWRWPV